MGRRSCQLMSLCGALALGAACGGGGGVIPEASADGGFTTLDAGIDGLAPVGQVEGGPVDVPVAPAADALGAESLPATDAEPRAGGDAADVNGIDLAAAADAAQVVSDSRAAEVAPPAPTGFVAVSAGTFHMGSPTGEDQARDEEQPSHTVTLSRPFLISDHEVTQAEWRAVMGADPSYHKDCGADCPVDSVTWFAALAFANALSSRAGFAPCYILDGCQDPLSAGLVCASATFAGPTCLGFRLPTEAEWEYAARAGATTSTQLASAVADWWICSSGSGATAYRNPLLGFCRYVCADGNGPAPVRSLAPNAWGLFDMAGNVSEWVWDVFAPYTASTVVDPLGPAAGAERIIRGTSSIGYGPDCRHARRDGLGPDWVSSGVGFRLVRTLP